MDIELIYQVCIIESLLGETTDGRILSVALSNVGVKNNYYSVNDEKELRECFEKMVADTAIEENGSSTKVPMLYIHFSAHGNKYGIELANRDFIRWPDLGDMLIRFSDQADRQTGSNTCLQTLCFSACEGLTGSCMSDGKSICPYFSIVGPRDKLTGYQLLEAFGAFYASVCLETGNVFEGVKRMNLAINEQRMFDVFLPPKVVPPS